MCLDRHKKKNPENAVECENRARSQTDRNPSVNLWSQLHGAYAWGAAEYELFKSEVIAIGFTDP